MDSSEQLVNSGKVWASVTSEVPTSVSSFDPCTVAMM